MRLAVIVVALLGLALVFACRSDAQQMGNYQCRTSPLGASTRYCASEAFVTASASQRTVLTFATLPTCDTANAGDLYGISDSNVSTFNATITAGAGTNSGLAYCDGTNWTFH